MKTNKLILSLCLFFFAVGISQAQIRAGIKGGLNFNSNGKLLQTASQIDSDNKLGYHFGGWMRIKIPVLGIFVQPELLYTHTQSEYDNTGDYKLNKIDIPVLFGTKILGIGKIYAGPAFQNILKAKLADQKLEDIEGFTVGMQLGAGVEFGKIGVDLRYERGLSKLESSITGTQDKIDSRAKQFILSLSYRL